MGPVFLLHVRIVVLSIGTRAGESYRFDSLAEVMEQMPVEKLASVIGVETQDGERQSGFDLGNLSNDGKLAAVRDCSRLGPLGMHIGGGNSPAKLSGHGFSAVSYGIGFDKT